MPRLAFVVAASAALAWGVFSGGCKPGPGSSCDPGEARCIAADRELVCQDGKFVETPCRGPSGCVLTPAGVSCDISKNRSGDPCAQLEEGAAVCIEQDRMIVCRAGSYRIEHCRGPEGCENTAGRAACDTSVSKIDDDCQQPAQRACAHDGTRLLGCRAGKMVSILSCRGENGCQAKRGKLECDLSVAAVGDPCQPEMEGNHACAADETSIVRCKRGKFVIDQPCAKSERCSNEPSSIACKKLGG